MSIVVCHQFSLGEIKEATKNFENILGNGGEGTVYLGHIPAIGTVAVKRLKSNLIDFDEEIKIVSKIKHPNLVSLHGYCEESGQKILVYEHMGKGSLSNYITKKSTRAERFPWQQRLKVCLGAARGLQHLHKETKDLGKGIIHRDIKPDNILLDDNWVAKVSDFGLCKLSHAGQIKSTMVTLLKGTGGYYAPEYIQYGSITRKLDVYAFGVVLFEVLCHKTPWDRGDESYYRLEDEDLGLWARENVHPDINEEISEDCLEAFTHIIGRSLQINPSIRPTMDDVVMDLECALKCQDLQDEGTRPKAPTRGRKATIPWSVQETIQKIKKITGNSEDEIYALLKQCSMDPLQTIHKLLIKGRKSMEITTELPKSSKTVALDNDRDITMGKNVMPARPAATDSDLLNIESPRRRNQRTSARTWQEFGFDELKEATNNFSIILSGKFGVTYKGILNDGRVVAVKHYMNIDRNIFDMLYTEIDVVYKVLHPNHVRLIGVCKGSRSLEFLLVHEFMKNGTLADHLFEEGVPLSWEQRLMICIDAARGLEYLHHGIANAKRIIHRNINPANIFLDENWTAKISEVWVGNLGNVITRNSAMKTDVKGTYKYLDPYYNLTGQLTRRTDTYAFGVVLFDVLFGRTDFNGGIEHKHEKLGQWAQQRLKDGSLDGIIDERLKGQISPESLKEFAELASSCVCDNPMKRPTMTHVVEWLESVLKTSQKARS